MLTNIGTSLQNTVSAEYIKLWLRLNCSYGLNFSPLHVILSTLQSPLQADCHWQPALHAKAKTKVYRGLAADFRR